MSVQRFSGRMSFSEAFKLLACTTADSDKDVESKARKMAFRYHPDKNWNKPEEEKKLAR